MSDAIDRILYTTGDPEYKINGRPVPAMTTMLYRVYGNDADKFQEALRLVELFIAAALADSARDSGVTRGNTGYGV